jgi:hypothetical protein
LKLSFGVLLKVLQNLMLSDVSEARVSTEALHDRLLENTIDKSSAAFAATGYRTLFYLERFELLETIGDQVNCSTTITLLVWRDG